MTVIKWFSTEALYNCSNLLYEYLNEEDKICECHWNCCNEAQFLNRKIIMKCSAIKIFAWNVLQLPIQKFNCKFMHIYYRLRGYVK